MNKKIEKTLEFNKIKLMISDEAISEEAKELILNMSTLTNISQLNNFQEENEAIMDLIRLRGLPSLLGTKNIIEIIKHLEVESTLTSKELISISDILTIVERFLEYLDDVEKIYTALPSSEKELAQTLKLKESVLKKYYDKLTPLPKINSEIKRIIISEDEIDDNASHTLHSLRLKRKTLENKLHQVANSLLNTYKDYLQESIVVLRNDKYCLPVKAEYKSKVPGILQDKSGSSFTLYIEPMQITELNNEIAKLLLDEQEEINAILESLSKSLFPYTQALQNNSNTLVYLDYLFAKGKFHKKFSCTRPIINTKHIINLKRAKHPLIDRNTCVPLDIHVGKDFIQLIITGPNTGGKTVALKTTGLVELMGLSGLFIPCENGSEISIFDEILADIGDEQSIEQSLSTFSSHMTNVISILKIANSNSLCLFDELGAGTDPTEGASLAISILEELKKRNSIVVATTHYPEIKIYAFTQENVMNANCEFDIESLKPTYKLLIGLPGKSNAFLISEKLGLSKNIIESAKKKLSKDTVKIEDVISSLNDSKKIIEKEKQEIDACKAEITFLQNKVKRQQKGLQDREASIIRKAKEEAHDILQNAKQTADTAIKNIKKIEEDVSSAKEVRTSISQTLNSIDESIYNDQVKNRKGPSLPISPSKIKIGDKVHILSMDMEAVVESLPDKDYNLFVRCGALKTKVKLRDLEYSSVFQSNTDLAKQNKKIPKYNISNESKEARELTNAKSLNISPEINVIGLRSDEALSVVEKYLDDAYLSNIPFVRIIHGRGTGVLRNTIHQYLKKLPTVKEYHNSDIYNGGDGSTDVIFRET